MAFLLATNIILLKYLSVTEILLLKTNCSKMFLLILKPATNFLHYISPVGIFQFQIFLSNFYVQKATIVFTHN